MPKPTLRCWPALKPPGPSVAVLEVELSFLFFPPKSFLNTEPSEDFLRWGFPSFKAEGVLAIEVRIALGWFVGGGGGSYDGRGGGGLALGESPMPLEAMRSG